MKEEVWKDILGYEGYYQISSLGRFRSLDRKVTYKNGTSVFYKGKITFTKPNKKGYYRGCLNKDGTGISVFIHRLVAEAFIPNPKNLPTVNHKNGVKTDNRVENLEWMTIEENNQHALRTGLNRLIGEKSASAKLTESDVRQIRGLLKTQLTQKEIGNLFGVKAWIIKEIKFGRAWSHVE